MRLTIARFATYCLKSLYENYKEEDASDILKKLKDYLTLINKDYKQVCAVIEAKRDSRLTGIEKDIGESWAKIQTTDLFLDKSEEAQINMAHTLSKIQQKYSKKSSKNNHMYAKSIEDIYQEELERWNANSIAPDKFIIRFFQDTLIPFNDEGYRKNIENCIYGYDVMKGEYDYQQWLVENYEASNNVVYPWLIHWIDGVRFFHQRKFEKSLVEMIQAFKTIRYSAGSHQRYFIEDYMLVALAQANRKGWKEFKVAFKWGVFMNNFDAFPEFYSDKSNKELKAMFEENRKAFGGVSESMLKK